MRKMKKIVILAIFLMTCSCFATMQYLQDMTIVIDMDTSDVADTVVTIGLTEGSDNLPYDIRPDEIILLVYINDTNYTSPPANTALVRVQGYFDGDYYDIIKFSGGSSYYGTSVTILDNVFYEKIRFIVTKNTGYCRVGYALRRER
jgi:hypothetical protein